MQPYLTTGALELGSRSALGGGFPKPGQVVLHRGPQDGVRECRDHVGSQGTM